ncbi:hypothetical protein HBI56_005320 [Parastagonospora nodorum]|uniref:MARVEL domain-containing protein n=2 Tax=Phaeosphaeria nodorum (strain SN15 / ATCC MYA-4574 / FGSC 10173) TaxID=321614 RepID=A0A7U2HUW8_PHANO|nr:hypothetical protein SNOG_00703 [Parastagonospora nodorum SN15]KAH3912301.1 hypothetical protein HBH56_124350 [Parastagonospora nodorum]EAT92198.1 hypothetical protein SNOG_00703 [Parastagonospora nodorum SN15]KAH3935294.1 hypothetical protein HBH54_049890 [Parastagonospora nodorum]KAH3950103.1 hypothetical protein HBH53_079470 [Parastagonospora nodorum]KAH3982708.1 hypothetical protein HBH51_037240 [Parastagonospora nodorum]
MTITRIASVALRLAQCTCSVIVIGIIAFLMSDDYKYPKSPDDDIAVSEWGFLLNYTMVIACFSLALSVLWMLNSTNAILRSIFDLGLAIAWIVSFLMHYAYWLGGTSWEPESKYQWDMPYGRAASAHQDSVETVDKAVQAFALMGAVLTFMSFLLGFVVCLKKDRNDEAGAYADGVTTPAVHLRIWTKNSSV